MIPPGYQEVNLITQDQFDRLTYEQQRMYAPAEELDLYGYDSALGMHPIAQGLPPPRINASGGSQNQDDQNNRTNSQAVD